MIFRIDFEAVIDNGMFPGRDATHTGLLKGRLQIIETEWFHQVVEGPQFGAVYCGVDGGITGDHDHVGIRVPGPDLF